jgi:hypothetical protein
VDLAVAAVRDDEPRGQGIRHRHWCHTRHCCCWGCKSRLCVTPCLTHFDSTCLEKQRKEEKRGEKRREEERIVLQSCIGIQLTCS